MKNVATNVSSKGWLTTTKKIGKKNNWSDVFHVSSDFKVSFARYLPTYLGSKLIRF